MGQFSVLFNRELTFKASAKTSVRLLTLSQDFFVNNAEVIEGIEDIIIEAEDFVDKNGVPRMDFKQYESDLHLKDTEPLKIGIQNQENLMAEPSGSFG